jgi:hypothetical protein
MRGFFLSAAALLVAFFAAAHLVGLRQDLSVIALSVPAGESFERAAAGAGLYLAAYFGATLLAPILVLAALLFGPLEALARSIRKRSPVVRVGASEAGNQPLRGHEADDGETQRDEVK